MICHPMVSHKIRIRFFQDSVPSTLLVLGGIDVCKESKLTFLFLSFFVCVGGQDSLGHKSPTPITRLLCTSSSSRAAMRSPLAPTTPRAGCTTSVRTRNWPSTPTTTSSAESPQWPSPSPAACCLPVMTTSTATCGIPCAQSEQVKISLPTKLISFFFSFSLSLFLFLPPPPPASVPRLPPSVAA